MSKGPPALLVRNVSKRFGGVEALRGVDLKVDQGEIFGVIGPNGAGKTVLMNLISGIYRPDTGEISLNGSNVTGLPPHYIARKGVARTFQITKVFPNMTTFQNIMTVLHAVRTEMDQNEKREAALKAFELVDLTETASLKAKSLSGGQKKLLEFARGIASDANLYLMDEPFAGVNPILVNRMLEAMRVLAGKEKTIVVVSHELGIISKICDLVAVLDRGEKIAEGTLKEVAMNPDVRRAYLGE